MLCWFIVAGIAVYVAVFHASCSSSGSFFSPLCALYSYCRRTVEFDLETLGSISDLPYLSQKHIFFHVEFFQVICKSGLLKAFFFPFEASCAEMKEEERRWHLKTVTYPLTKLLLASKQMDELVGYLSIINMPLMIQSTVVSKLLTDFK